MLSICICPKFCCLEKRVNPLLHRYSFLTNQQQNAFENIVGKGEIARNEQFLLFLTMFSTREDNHILIRPHFCHLISLFAAELEEPKIGISGKGLNTPPPAQIINVRVLQYLQQMKSYSFTFRVFLDAILHLCFSSITYTDSFFATFRY